MTCSLGLLHRSVDVSYLIEIEVSNLPEGYNKSDGDDETDGWGDSYALIEHSMLESIGVKHD